ncbi:MAG TPA: amino acid permease, partial [bacterium]|nr:amino acid permease [bacterium]
MVTDENTSCGAPIRVLGLFDSICIIVGIIVGTGIFMTPMAIAGMIPSVPLILLAWILGGALCVAGGFCYAELAATYPKAGGEYVYFCRAFGPWAGFLFSWSKMLVIRTGSIAAMAYAFGTYAEQVFSLGAHSIPLYAGFAILLLTGLNILGVRVGSLGQNILTVAKVGGVLGVLIVALMQPSSPPVMEVGGGSTTLSNFMIAMILILWTYGGWNETAYVAAEVRNPEKNLPRSILYGTMFVIVLYTAINGAFLWTLGITGVAGSKAVAA